MRAKIVIVGGGVMGVSIALHSARRNDPIKEPVVLLERDTLGAGSSGRSGAVLRQFYASRVVAGMARDSLKVYAGFARHTGRSIGFQRAGVLTLSASTEPGRIAELERIVEELTSIGVEVRRVDAAEMRRVFPGIQVPDGAVGAFEPGGGFVDPGLTIESMAALARTYGAVVWPGRETHRLLFENGRIVGVETDEGRIECETVVVAAGPWTRRFLERHDLALPLHALRTRQHFVRGSGAAEAADLSDPEDAGEVEGSGATDWILGGVAAAQRLDRELHDRFAPAVDMGRAAHPVLLDLELGMYVRPEPGRGRTRVARLDYEGEPLVEDPDRLEGAVDPAFRKWARERLQQRLPMYRELPDLDAEVALYTVTPDAQAIIGPIASRPGLFVVSGFSGHGFKLAPAIGEGVAQMIAGEPVSAFEPSFFAPERFAPDAEIAPPRPFGL